MTLRSRLKAVILECLDKLKLMSKGDFVSLNMIKVLINYKEPTLTAFHTKNKET